MNLKFKETFDAFLMQKNINTKSKTTAEKQQKVINTQLNKKLQTIYRPLWSKFDSTGEHKHKHIHINKAQSNQLM